MGLSASETMRAAQSLYEGGYITYMRTDNGELSEEGREVGVRVVEGEFGRGEGREVEGGKKDKGEKKTKEEEEEAHEAIRPSVHDGRFLKREELGKEVGKKEQVRNDEQIILHPDVDTLRCANLNPDRSLPSLIATAAVLTHL